MDKKKFTTPLKSLSFNTWLAKERVQQGLSTEELGKEAYLDESTIRFIEKFFDRSPRLDTAERLSRGLGYKLWEVLKHLDI